MPEHIGDQQLLFIKALREGEGKAGMRDDGAHTEGLAPRTKRIPTEQPRKQSVGKQAASLHPLYSGKVQNCTVNMGNREASVIIRGVETEAVTRQLYLPQERSKNTQSRIKAAAMETRQ